ncbi:MAG: hypothetical protein K5756_10415 [Clostridiales bacterium]|nr:hypothetical protein [Clostridiales bacterium]
MGKQSFLPVTEKGYNVIIADEYISALQEEYSKIREWGISLAKKLEEQDAVIEKLREENRRLAEQNNAIYDGGRSIARKLGASDEVQEGEFDPEKLKELIDEIISSADQIRNEANIYAGKTIEKAQRTAEGIETECKKSISELSAVLAKMQKDIALYSDND